MSRTGLGSGSFTLPDSVAQSPQPVSPRGKSINHRPSMAIVPKMLRTLNVFSPTGSKSTGGGSHLKSPNASSLLSEDARISTSAVAQTMSIVFSHVLAPLWAIGAEPPARNSSGDAMLMTDSRSELLKYMDRNGHDLNNLTAALSQSPDLTTMYITVLAMRILQLETLGDLQSFDQCGLELVKENSKLHDPTKATGKNNPRPETVQYNDEIATHDQKRRKITRVGGEWKSTRVREFPPKLNAIRIDMLYSMLWASVCHRYAYNDDLLCVLIHEIATKVVLVHWNEKVLELCCGVKGHCYLAKYLWFLCRPMYPALVDDCVATASYSLTQSYSLQQAVIPIYTAVLNLCHTNDVGELILQAIIQAFTLVEERQLPAMLALTRILLRHIAIPYRMVIALIETMYPCVCMANPVGELALQIIQDVSNVIRSADSLSRNHFSTLLVGGSSLATFKRQRVYLLYNPFCTRSFMIDRIHLGQVAMTRSFAVKKIPEGSLSVKPKKGNFEGFEKVDLSAAAAEYKVPPTDEILTAANLVVNVFQYMVDLYYDEKPCPIKLAILYSIPPYKMAQYYPHVHKLLGPQSNFGDHANTDPEIHGRILELYNTVIAENTALLMKSRRHRLEAPWYPMLNMYPVVIPEEPALPTDTETKLRDTIWTSILDEVTQCEGAWVQESATPSERIHPKPSGRIENPHIVRVAIGGGGWSLQSFVTAMIHRMQRGGADRRENYVFKVYPLPMGYDNILCSWLESLDPLYGSLVYFPMIESDGVESEQKVLQADMDTAAALSTPPDTVEKGRLRAALDNYFTFANKSRSVLVYKLEGHSAERGRETVLIPFVSYVEIGCHLQAAGPAAHLTPILSSPRMPEYDGSNSSFLHAEPNNPGSQTSFMRRTGIDNNPPSMSSFTESFYRDKTKSTMGNVIKFGESASVMADKLHQMMCAELMPRDQSRCTGTEVVAYLTRVFHVTNMEAKQGALKCIELGILTISQKPNETVGAFESNYYVLRERNDADTVAMSPMSSRNRRLAVANSTKPELRATMNLKLKLTCPSERSDDYRYAELQSGTEMQLHYLSLKNMARPGDRGLNPDPTSGVLQLYCSEADKHRRRLTDTGEHYQIQGQLEIEGSMNEFFVNVDGEILGPFIRVVVKPYEVTPGTQVKFDVMSFM